MNNNEISFNEVNAHQVFGILDKMWVQKKGIFKKNNVLPENRYPVIADEREYANFLFCAALPMRGGVISDSPFRWLWELRRKFPSLFEPEAVAKLWLPEEILDAFRTVTVKVLNGNGIGEKGYGVLSMHAEQHAKNWYENLSVLHRSWGGDIRNVFLSVSDFEEAFARIDYKRSEKPFKGMRRKIFSLLTIWLQEKELIPLFPTPIPVDFHALRILWATEVIDFAFAKPFVPREKHSPQLSGKIAVRMFEGYIDQVAIWSQKFIQKNGFSHMNINPAIWILSRVLCAENFQNSSRKDGKRYFEAGEIMKNPDIWPNKYRDPCLSCPLEYFCKWAIPSAPYYRWGLLTRISERVAYNGPNLRLPFNWVEIPYFNPKKRP